MPRGKVKFYDAEKGFGFILDDEDGQSVYVHASNLPEGVSALRPGARVDEVRLAPAEHFALRV